MTTLTQQKAVLTSASTGDRGDAGYKKRYEVVIIPQVDFVRAGGRDIIKYDVSVSWGRNEGYNLQHQHNSTHYSWESAARVAKELIDAKRKKGYRVESNEWFDHEAGNFIRP